MHRIFKNILALFFLFILGNVSSQGLFKYFKWTAYSDGAERIDHLVVDFNANRLLSTPDGITQGHFSFGVNAYMFHDHPINKKGTIAWALGLGFSGYNIHHDGRFNYTTLSDGTPYTELVPIPDGINLLKNKLSLNYLELPFELRFRSMKISEEERKAANFRFYLGFKGGYLVNNHTKYRDNHVKIKTFNIKNVLPYRYGPTLRLGFKKISFHAFYSLTSIFEEGKGPELVPFSVGLTWIRL